MTDIADAARGLKYEQTKVDAAGRSAVVIYRRLRSYGYEVVEWCAPPRPYTDGWWVVKVQRGAAEPVYRNIRLYDGRWQIMATPADVLERVMSAPISANDNDGSAQ